MGEAYCSTTTGEMPEDAQDRIVHGGGRAIRLFISGTTVTLKASLAERDYLGFLTTPKSWNSIESICDLDLPWGMDNGAFAGFDHVAFFALLDRAKKAAQKPEWVACPDKVADAKETLCLFETWEPVIHWRGFRVAFVGQDGQEDLPVPWDRFECFFIGGSTRWKLSQHAADLGREAKERGKWLHVGRVNSFRRLRYAFGMGADSVDGTGISRWGKVHLLKFVGWIKRLERDRNRYTSELTA